jgi:sodium/proline symporter
MISVGLYWNRRAKTSEDYMIGGRAMGPVVTALTLQTTAMSGFMFMGGPALAYSLGYFALFYSVGDAGGAIVNCSILGRRMRRLSQLLDAISPIEYLEKRYESIPVKILGCVIAVMGLGTYILGQFLATGKTLVSLFGFSFTWGLIIGCGVIMLYTFIGGYFAVAWNDVIQGIIMAVTVLVLLALCLVDVGGFTGLNEKLAQIDPTYLSIWGKGNQYEGAWGIIAGAVLVFLIGYMGLPHCVNKHIAMESPKTAKKTIVYATVWTQLFCFSPYFIALCGLILLPNLEDPEMIIPSLTALQYPAVVSGILLTAIMSAIMSTVASLLLLVGTIVSIDFYKRWLRPDASDKSVVFISKASIFVVTAVGITVAIINPPGVFEVVVDAFSFLACSFLPSYVCAVWWKKANGTGSVLSMIVGSITVLIWTLTGLDAVTGLHQFFIGIVLSWIAMLVGSSFGKPVSPEMRQLMDRAKGTKANVPPKVQAAASKHLSTETKVISQFLFSNRNTALPELSNGQL